jgi:hypothetical protein
VVAVVVEDITDSIAVVVEAVTKVGYYRGVSGVGGGNYRDGNGGV